MEELDLQERSGFFTKLREKFIKDEPVEDIYDERPVSAKPVYTVHNANRYSITVRRQIFTFQDAVAAADGLKRGEQQILNLCAAEPTLREKIKDFMSGVNYAEEGTWEELGENIYLLAPPSASVEVAPASPRMTAQRN
ncbi:MAG: cell division protein SepF [Armatimonadetes bacterium]|nr:cell division protein SepF [Armatimonadota bacterium]